MNALTAYIFRVRPDDSDAAACAGLRLWPSLHPQDLRFTRNRHGKPFLDHPALDLKEPPAPHSTASTTDHETMHIGPSEVRGPKVVPSPAARLPTSAPSPRPPRSQLLPQQQGGGGPGKMWQPDLGLGLGQWPALQFSTTHTGGAVGECALPSTVGGCAPSKLSKQNPHTVPARPHILLHRSGCAC